MAAEAGVVGAHAEAAVREALDGVALCDGVEAGGALPLRFGGAVVICSGVVCACRQCFVGSWRPLWTRLGACRRSARDISRRAPVYYR